MSQDEFTETPYAASFGPAPVVYRPITDTSVDQPSVPAPAPVVAPVVTPAMTPAPVQALPAAVEPIHENVRPPSPPAPRQSRRRHDRSSRSARAAAPSLDSVVVDDNTQKSLDAANRLGQIDIHDTDTWEENVGTVLSGLRNIQMQWNDLDAERKRLTRVTNGPGFSTRGVRRRGRGRGRRRGRWRGV